MRLKKRKNLMGREIKSVIIMLLMVVMVAGMLPLSASAAAENVTVKKNVEYYPSGALQSITPVFGWESGKAAATVQLVLMKEQLRSTTEGNEHGDFTDYGTYGKAFTTYEDAVKFDNANDGIFGIIAASGKERVSGGSANNELTISLKENAIPLDTDGIYYIYLWTYYNSHYYPDDLLCVVRVQNGRVQYTAATGQNSYDEDDFSAVVSLNLENVTFGYAYDAQRSPKYPEKADTQMVMSKLAEPLGADGTRIDKQGSWKLSRVGAYANVPANENLETVVKNVADEYNLNADSVVIHELKKNDTHIAYGVVIAYDALEGYAVFLGDNWGSGSGYLLSLKEITETSKTVTAGTIATDFIDTETPNAVFTAQGADGGILTDVDSSMKYRVAKSSTAGGEWIEISDTSVTLAKLEAGDIIQIKRFGDGTATKDSPVQEIVVTQAETPTGLKGVACTTSEQNNGQITGVDSTMEYRLSTVDEWTAVAESAVTGLSAGNYQVRVKADGAVLASGYVEVTVKEHVHTGGEATCQNKAKCEVCGEEYGELAPHTMSKDYEADGDKHYHVCSVCEEKDEGEAHQWNVNQATEETDKHCEICGFVAEAKLDHTHKGTLIEGTDPTCANPGSKAYYTCECGKNFEDEACTIEITNLDDWKKIPATGQHKGGKATCTAKAKCEVCGEEYGELADHVWDEGKVTKQATASAEGEKTYTCTTPGCSETKRESIAKCKPSIIEGMNGTWTQDANKGLSFRSDAAFADFISVAVDGKVIDKKNYTAVSGSIVVELKPEYLTTLSAGKHTLAIRSASGSAESEFTIKGKEAGGIKPDTDNKKPTPTEQKTSAVKTGDSASPMIWVLALVISLAGIICIFTYTRRHRNR